MSDVAPQTAAYSFVSLIGMALTAYGYWQKAKNTARIKKAEKEIGPTLTAQDQLNSLKMSILQHDLDKEKLLNEILREQIKERDREIDRLTFELFERNRQLLRIETAARVRAKALPAVVEIVQKKHQTEEDG